MFVGAQRISIYDWGCQGFVAPPTPPEHGMGPGFRGPPLPPRAWHGAPQWVWFLALFSLFLALSLFGVVEFGWGECHRGDMQDHVIVFDMGLRSQCMHAPGLGGARMGRPLKAAAPSTQHAAALQ